MFGVRTRIEWNHAAVAAIVAGPGKAHVMAAEAAAKAAAARIGGSGSGALARDVGTPNFTGQARGPGGRFSGGYSAEIGSALPYARIEHFGGVIEARNPDAYGRYLLYIRPGQIEAAVPSVVHHGKRYLDVATSVYVQAMYAGMKAIIPG